MFFESWEGIIRVFIVGALAYVVLIVLLLASGKRTLSKMNAFDFVVTVAMGSTLATVLLSKDVPLLEGVAAFTLLIALQFIITWSSMRSERVQKLSRSAPTLLFFRGEFMEEAMRRERVPKGAIRAAVRAQGIMALENVEAVVLETDGSVTVISRTDGGSSQSALEDVQNVPAHV